MPYIFVDDGFPEAADFDDNYVRAGRAVPLRPAAGADEEAAPAAERPADGRSARRYCCSSTR